MRMTVETTGVQDGAEEQRAAVHKCDKWLANFNSGIADNNRLQSTCPQFFFTDTSCRSRMSQQLLPHVR